MSDFLIVLAAFAVCIVGSFLLAVLGEPSSRWLWSAVLGVM
jgi:hypothetical protein